MAARWVVGAKSVLRALDSPDPPSCVVIARDAPADLVEPVRARAAELRLEVLEAESAIALGHACGVTRPVATAMRSGLRG
ncbi:MAG TPA: ribosomal L7Ae/L30e/S12e/Gadd45 family protein [Mycobacteriales bacterium]|nr:ribosomal L7Ae/L30e/S12e/Gadd45 family protein [Mycobacteriales bacterium]